eukprot:g531.t1
MSFDLPPAPLSPSQLMRKTPRKVTAITDDLDLPSVAELQSKARELEMNERRRMPRRITAVTDEELGLLNGRKRMPRRITAVTDEELGIQPMSPRVLRAAKASAQRWDMVQNAIRAVGSAAMMPSAPALPKDFKRRRSSSFPTPPQVPGKTILQHKNSFLDG